MPRHPLPTAIKRARGTLRADRVNRSEPKSEVSAPPCPRELSPAAKREYRRMARELVAAGVITRLDRAVLAGYAISWATVLKAESEIANTGSVIRSPRTGGAVISPFQLLQSTALKALKNFAAELGGSPSSRSRVHALEKPTGGVDEFELYLQGRGPLPGAQRDDDDDDLPLN
jgi:P27 family predicted phage terminase small subunit